MRPLIYTVIIISSIFSNVFAQAANTSINELALNYGHYFELPRESVFLHLNKSTYIVGENIWFKGFIYNRREGRPFRETSNLYVGLYDGEGKQLKKNLYYSNDGYSQGNIELDSTLSSGEYYIKASTNWMRNFKEDDSFQQKITIYNGNVSFKRAQLVKNYDMQFLPEGGNMIEGILNVIGVKIIDDKGRGVKINEALVKDNRGSQVALFNTSKFGLGKFLFTPDNSKIYSVKVLFNNGSERTFLLPKAKKEGVNIRIEDNDENRLLVSLSTNAKTRKKNNDKSFYLLIHRDGLIRKVKVDFPKNQNYVSLLLDKIELHDYINIITLVDYNNKPVAERLFFNWKNFKEFNFQLSNQKQDHDSIALKMKLVDTNEFLKEISISILPKNTLSYDHSDNILSAFYLKPYVKGFIETPSYYFKSVTKKKKKELDLLLITQGWSRYVWQEINSKPPQKKFDFEQGMFLEAIVNSKIKEGNKIFLHKSKNHESQEISFFDGEFKLTNLYPVLGEKLFISLKNKRGKLLRPDMYVTLKNNMIQDKLDFNDLLRDGVKRIDMVPYENKNIRKNFILKTNTVILEEVVVSAEKKNRLAENNSLVPKYMKDKVTEVDVDLARNYPRIADILRSRGYEVAEELQLIPNVDPNSQPVPPISRVRVRSRRSGGILLVIDGVRQEGLDVIYQFPTTQLESFYFDRLSRYEGAMSQNKETLYLFTRKGKELDVTPQNGFDEGNSFVHNVSNGFRPIKQFYIPKYSTYLDKSFEDFGVVHWEPNLTLDANGEATFKILNTGLKELSFFIEGMGRDGSLISTSVHQN